MVRTHLFSDRRRRFALLVSGLVLALTVAVVHPTATVAATSTRTVHGCDPFTGKLVDRSIDELINPTKSGPTPQYTAPDRNGTIGTLWTPSCEPTNNTGNGSCYIGDDNRSVTVELSPNVAAKFVKNLPVGLKLQVTWLLIRRNKSDGTINVESIFIVSPVATAAYPGTLTADVAAQYLYQWWDVYRALKNPPAGSGVPSADTLWNALASYGQFLELGGLIKDSSLLDVASALGAPVLPPPYVAGHASGAAVSVGVGGVNLGLTNWTGPYSLDLNRTDATNIGAILQGSSAAGGTPAAQSRLDGDLIMTTPDLTGSGDLSAPLQRVVAGLLGSTGPAGWLSNLRAKYSSGVIIDQLDMSDNKTPAGSEQTAVMEFVVRVPMILALDFAPAGSTASSQARTWLNTIGKQSVWQKWAAAVRAGGKISGGPSIALRYTKRVDLADRTPDAAGNLALWQKIKDTRGLDPAPIISLFAPGGSAAIQEYVGSAVSVVNPLGVASLRIPGTKVKVGVADASRVDVSGSLSVRTLNLVDAWQNQPGQAGVDWIPWKSCRSLTVTDPNASIYGPDYQAYFSPGPYDVYNPAAPKYDWPASGNPKDALVDPALDTVVAAVTDGAQEVPWNQSEAHAIETANLAAASVRSTALSAACKLLSVNCPKIPLVLTDNSLGGTTTRFYTNEIEATAGRDGWCGRGSSHPDDYACTTFDGNGPAVITFPANGTVMRWDGADHTAATTPPAAGGLPFCLPQWYAQIAPFHAAGTPNVYYCAFWS